MGAIYTLGSVVLRGDSTYRWGIVNGVRPYTGYWLVTAKCAEDLVAQGLGKPLTFTCRGAGKEIKVEQAYALEIRPAHNPKFRKVMVQDKRYRWLYAWLSANFNMPMATGELTAFNDTGEPTVRVTDPKFLYNPSSLFPFKKDGFGTEVWSASRILRHFLQSDAPDGLKEVVTVKGLGPQKPVQKLIIDDRGDDAIERVLGFISGTSLFIRVTGEVVVYDTRSDAGEIIAERTRLGHLNAGESLKVNRKARRPKSVICLFDVKADIKYDFFEGSETVNFLTDEPNIINVARNTDFELQATFTTPAGPATRKVPRGTLMEINELMRAYQASGLVGKDGIHLTQDIIRKNIMNNHGSIIELMYATQPEGVVQNILQLRCREIVASWRKLFRIIPGWFARVETFEAARSALRNPEMGENAPSLVYSGYIRRPQAAVPLVPLKSTPNGVIGPKYGAPPKGAVISEDVLAPVDVEKKAGHLGLIELKPKADPFGLYDFVTLGYPEAFVAPPGALEFVAPYLNGIKWANLTRELAFVSWSFIALEGFHRLAVVMSTTPATPQNIDRYYQVEIELGGDGPSLHSRIRIEPARFVWKDEDAEQIKDTFRGKFKWATLDKLLTNKERLQNIAEAEAKRIEDRFRDRTLGEHRVPGRSDFEPDGTLSGVILGATDQRIVADLFWEEEEIPSELWREMDQSTREVVYRILQNKNSTP